MYIKDLIIKKREQKELDEEELHFFIQGYFKGEISEEQAASLITLMCVNGITYKEMAYLSVAMAETGEQIDLYRISNKIVDIHAIGGIEDKLILILNSIMTALKIPSAKIIGRELGMTDRLNSIKGFNYKKDVTELKDLIQKNGYAIIKEPSDLAPIENKFYRLKKLTACDHYIPLIAISMMSQKIAIGAKNIVFDITCGENAYVKDYNDARKLSKHLVQMGKIINKNVVCVITDFFQPLGKCFGNLIEIQEIIDCLRGKATKDMQEMIMTMGQYAISLATGNKNYKEVRNLILNTIDSGEALKSFFSIIENQNGNIDFVQNIRSAKNIIPIISTENGNISNINISKIRACAQYLGAIRKESNDSIDPYAGIEFSKKVGDKVKRGEILGYIHTDDEPKIQAAMQMILRSYEISRKNTKTKQRILEVI